MIFHEEGASTAKIGMDVVSRALIMEGKGSRISPLNEKPASS